MRIDYIKYPIIKYFEDGKLGDYLGCRDRDTLKYFGNMYNEIFKKIIQNPSDITYVAKPFMDTLLQDNISSKLINLIEEVPSKNGIILLHNGISYAYRIFNDSNTTKKGAQFFYLEENILYGYYSFSFDKNGVHEESIANYWDNKNEVSNKMHFLIISLILLFKEYADVNEKILNKKKGEEIFNCKYVNDTNKGIKILDSTWFTTLIKSESFKVRGHFRLQPCGEGLKKKKLIWINDFQKNGYTRIAKKLNKE